MTGELWRHRPLALAGAAVLLWAAMLMMVVTSEGVAEDDGPVLGWFLAHRSHTATLVLGGVSSTPVDAAIVLGAGAVVGAMAWRAPSPDLGPR